jgi:hypothetical protein
MHRSKRKASRAPDLAIAIGDVVVLVLPVAAFAGEVGAAMADLPNRHDRAARPRDAGMVLVWAIAARSDNQSVNPALGALLAGLPTPAIWPIYH